MMLSVSEKTFSKFVLESSQPVLVYFWAPWCGLCQFIQPLLLKLQSECQEPLKLFTVNADANFKLTNTYGIRSLPTLILFEQGIAICRLEDFQGREDLQQKLNGLKVGILPQSA